MHEPLLTHMTEMRTKSVLYLMAAFILAASGNNVKHSMSCIDTTLDLLRRPMLLL